MSFFLGGRILPLFRPGTFDRQVRVFMEHEDKPAMRELLKIVEAAFLELRVLDVQSKSRPRRRGSCGLIRGEIPGRIGRFHVADRLILLLFGRGHLRHNLQLPQQLLALLVVVIAQQ